MTCYNRVPKAFSQAVTGLSSVRREHRRSAPQTASSGENEGPGEKKRLVSVLLEMGMSEATPLQRLPAAGATSSFAVSCFWRDKPLNKPAAAPSISLSLEQFPSKRRVECVGVIEK